MAYISSLDRKRDYVNTIAFAKKEAREEERTKAEAEKLLEKKESAEKMLKAGLAIDAISDFTGLTVEQIEKLK